MHSEAAVKYTWPKMQPVMDNWRRCNRPRHPPIPRDLQHYTTLLSMPQYTDIISYSKGRLNSSTLVASDSNFVAVLYSLNFVESITTTTLFMDATFKITPKQPKIYQVFTILALVEKQDLPISWILMPKKTAAAYQIGLEYFKNQVAPHMNPQIIMTDFESGLKCALRQVFPQAVHVGCFFHFCQALIKKFKKLRLLVTISTWRYGQIIIRKFMALALLPANDVVNGYQWLLDNIPDEIKGLLQPFLVYFYDEWIVRTPPNLWSVYNLHHRTNNVTETYHRKANLRFGAHASIWNFTEVLTQIQAVTHIELESSRNGDEITTGTRTPEELDRDERIKTAWDLYSNGIIGILNFLACASNFLHAFQHNRNMTENADRNEAYENFAIFMEQDVMDISE